MVFGQSATTCSSEWEPQLASSSLPSTSGALSSWSLTQRDPVLKPMPLFFFLAFLNLAMVGKKGYNTARVHNTVLKLVLGMRV